MTIEKSKQFPWAYVATGKVKGQLFVSVGETRNEALEREMKKIDLFLSTGFKFI